MDKNEIKRLIEKGLKNSTAVIEGDDGRHFTATVTSSEFTGKNRVQKQQLVYAVLRDKIADGSIHAISIKTLEPHH